MKLFAATVVLLCAGLVPAHPGHEASDSVTEQDRMLYLSMARRSLDECSHKLHEDGILKRAAEDRLNLFNKLRAAHQEAKRDTKDVLAKSHHSSAKIASADSFDKSLFMGNSTCILNPEGEIGPFWVSGEHVRQDVTEGEKGVPVNLHVQFLDAKTCKPIPNLHFEIWHANSTGVYAGVQSFINGNSSDASNLDRTALRGIQATDADGIGSFRTIFPGHYQGRAIHIHVLAHIGATVLPNGTLTGGAVPHIGQMFFDMDLIQTVEKIAPYTNNRMNLTQNRDDFILAYMTANTTSDPVLNYALIDDNNVGAGIVAWSTLALDTSRNFTTMCGAALSDKGGKMCDMMPGGPGFGPPGGGPGGFGPPGGGRGPPGGGGFPFPFTPGGPFPTNFPFPPGGMPPGGMPPGGMRGSAPPAAAQPTQSP